MPELRTRIDSNGEAILFEVPTAEDWANDLEGYTSNVYRLMGAVVAHAIAAANDGDQEAQEFLTEIRGCVSARAGRFLCQTSAVIARSIRERRSDFAFDRNGRQLGEESRAVLQTLDTGVAIQIPMNQRALACLRTKFKEVATRRGLRAHCHDGGNGSILAWVTPLDCPRELQRLPLERFKGMT